MAQKKKAKKPRARQAQTEKQILAEHWNTGFGKTLTKMRQVLRKAWMRGPAAYTIVLIAVELELHRERSVITAFLEATYPDMLQAIDRQGEPADRLCGDPN